jgi:hypothetical protein
MSDVNVCSLMVGENMAQVDKIGPWSKVKLDILREYASAYTTILSKHPEIKRFIYIGAFAGAGKHKLRGADEFVEGMRNSTGAVVYYLYFASPKDGTSINQPINSAVAEKISALLTEEYLAARARRGRRRMFEAVLKRVPDVEPNENDRIG